MKKVLITGGAGFIGSNLAGRLVNSSELTVIDNLVTGSKQNLRHIKCKFIKADICNPTVVERLVKDTDLVYHLAAVVGVRKVIDNPITTIRTNLIGTENILGFCYKYRKQVLIASSSEVYGKGLKIPFKETDDRIYGQTSNLRWIYAQTKALDEAIALVYKKKGLKIIIARLFNIVGPKQSSAYGMVIPSFIKSALEGTPIQVYGTGEQTRCFLHVDDLTNAMDKLMKTGPAIGEIINIGSTEEITIIDLARKIKQLTKSRSRIVRVPYAKAYQSSDFEEMMRRKPDISKIKSLIKFSPTRNIDSIISDVILNYQC